MVRRNEGNEGEKNEKRGRRKGRGYEEAASVEEAPPRERKLPNFSCVALKCHSGKHLREENGELRASSSIVKDPEKFELLRHEDGRVSLKCHSGRLVAVDRNGDLKAAGGGQLEENSKFHLECLDCERCALKTSSCGYVAAEPNGRLKANRSVVGAWEVFQLKDRSGKAKSPALEPAPAPAPDTPFLDAFCHLEDVLLAEERYGKTHTDRTAILFEKRARARRREGRHLNFQHFCEEHQYPAAFRGCVSAWDVTSLEENWKAILEEDTVWAIFGIPAASAEAPTAIARLAELAAHEKCKALGPIGVVWADLPLPLEGDMAEQFGGMSCSAILAEFGAAPTQSYDVSRDPAFLEWSRAAGSTAKPETWVLRHGDQRLRQFEAARSDHARRRLEAQVEVAKEQLQLAKDLGLPVILQVPPQDQAERSMAELLVSVFGEQSQHPMLLSSFHGRPKCVPAFLRSFPKMMMAFSGLLTHSKHKRMLGLMAFDVPLDRLVLESLGPHFPPSGLQGQSRGSFSQPKHVLQIAEAVAEVKGLLAAEVLEAALANTQRFYGI
ncbi:unnamed protein product [Effrenium voratum]|uniref:Fascin-like domain-containing protein n=1 Tax=Effrenium voratum TaxID=2562239 RepID=A0AA36HXE0_9DINO|nr:unnamed protein product [Effrenium voratum]CAJ1418756.1 unnamed protein product [Effrenium voratum]